MNVLFDHQVFSNQSMGGISRYFSMLMWNLKSHSLANVQLAVRVSSNYHLKHPSFHSFAHMPVTFGIRGVRGIMKFVNERLSRRLISDGNYDIFHPTYYHPYFLDFIGNRPYVLTVFDLIHDLFPQDCVGGPDFHMWMDLTTQDAAAIIAISESTKRDLVRLYKVPAEKVFVIHLAPMELSPVHSFRPWIPPYQYILFVGDRHGYKNFDLLLAVIPDVFSRNRSLHLVCVGGGPFTRRESNAIAASGLTSRVHQVRVSDSVLGMLYSKALMLIYPSRYEGFGMPVLEALSCGCAVITSNVASLPEIAGDAAKYIFPEDPDSLRSAICEILDDPGQRGDMIEKGRRRALEFSWRKTAELTMRVYDEVLTNGAR